MYRGIEIKRKNKLRDVVDHDFKEAVDGWCSEPNLPLRFVSPTFLYCFPFGSLVSYASISSICS